MNINYYCYLLTESVRMEDFMNKIITIGRQYGSGGREIGYKLAQHYGIPFYDNEIITRAAKESGFAEETFARAEDKAANSLLYSLAMGIMLQQWKWKKWNGRKMRKQVK